MPDAYAELCRQRADECWEEAERATDSRAKMHWLKLADEWSKLAQDIERETS
jgi:hypothetical protein